MDILHRHQIGGKMVVLGISMRRKIGYRKYPGGYPVDILKTSLCWLGSRRETFSHTLATRILANYHFDQINLRGKNALASFPGFKRNFKRGNCNRRLLPFIKDFFLFYNMIFEHPFCPSGQPHEIKTVGDEGAGNYMREIM